MTIALVKSSSQSVTVRTCLLVIGILMSISAALADGNAVRMEEATAWVKEEVEFRQRDAQGNPIWTLSFSWALTSLEYSMSRLSSFRYQGFVKNEVLPSFDHPRSLENGIGACGNYVQLACDLIKKSPTPLPCRSVQFYLHNEKLSKNNSHVAIEVFYDGDWHLFDPYYGIAPLAPGVFKPSKILSTTDTMKLIERNMEFPRLDIGRCHMRLSFQKKGGAYSTT